MRNRIIVRTFVPLLFVSSTLASNFHWKYYFEGYGGSKILIRDFLFYLNFGAVSRVEIKREGMTILSQDNFLSLAFCFFFFYHLQRSVTGICHFTPHLSIQHPPHFLFLPQRPILPNYKRSPRSETRYSHSRVWLRSARGPSHTIFYHLLPSNSYLSLSSIFLFYFVVFSLLPLPRP